MSVLDYDALAREVLDVRGKSGDELQALCPFHGDSSPSLWFNVKKGLWICYACNEGGGLKTLYSKLGKSDALISAPRTSADEALAAIEEELADWAAKTSAKVCACHAVYSSAVELVSPAPEELSRSSLTGVNALGYNLVLQVLTTSTSTGSSPGRCDTCARPLILKPEFLKKFSVKTLTSFQNYLDERSISYGRSDGKPSTTREGVDLRAASSTADLFELGWDSLNRAVTMPYRDEYGLLLGVVHRRLRGKPKYNYPRKFPRTETLYGSWLLTKDLSQVPRLDRSVLPEKWVVLCEGPFDVMKVWQSGIPAVGMWGSMLHDRQAQMLSKLGVRGVVLFTDRDAAGRSAASSAAGKLIRYGFDVKTVRYPDSYPASYSDPGSLPEMLIRSRVRKSKWQSHKGL